MSSSKKTSAKPTDSVEPIRRRRLRTALAAGVTAVVGISLVVTAMVFAIASGTADTADEGEVGILSEASLSAAAAVRNSIVQAQILAEASELGVATAEELDRALSQYDAATGEFMSRIDRLHADTDDSTRQDPILDEANLLVSLTVSAADSIRAGNLEGSAALIEDEIETAYGLLANRLAATRDSAMGRIALAGEDAGRIADATRFLVVLLVPLTVLLAYRKRLRSAQMRRDLEHRLEKQQAVSQAQDEFIANLSHELRTPLTAIYGFSLELIEPGRTPDPALDHELAKYIASESADLSRMVEDILTAASADQDVLSISLETVDPVAEIDSVIGALRATGARIESNLVAASITTDPLRFRQIIRNLVSNAIRHGGPNNLVAGRINDEFYTIQVRDDGPGIPDSLQDRLFTRFIHQGNEPLLTGSVGLGLAIAQLLTISTGGSISYRRDRGETVFELRFPLATSEPLDQPPVTRRDPIADAALPNPELVSEPPRSSAEPYGRPYVYKPRWRDRDPVAEPAHHPPSSRPPGPDLKNFRSNPSTRLDQ
jgi:signal transduction histidine kinase